MLRDSSAWIGVKRDGGTTRVVDGQRPDHGQQLEHHRHRHRGRERDRLRRPDLAAGQRADIRPGAGRPARFSYSTDGVTFTRLGPAFTLNNAWQFFMGYRFAIFNYATQALGGAVTVRGSS